MSVDQAKYVYGLLHPCRATDAERYNDTWVGSHTLGVEVTELELAERCGLGNIDPQHMGGDSTTAAIDLALTWPIPPPAASLVTIRIDADACGTMAVLALRSLGLQFKTNWIERIALISAADRFAMGAWPGVRPLLTRFTEIDEVEGSQGIRAMMSGALTSNDITKVVGHFGRWIVDAEVPEAWSISARHAPDVLFKALKSGELSVRDEMPGVIAIVEGNAPAAIRFGYRRAPIVVALGSHDSKRRITIAQYELGRADLGQVARELSVNEPGWGGSPTIIGSPQGIECRTSLNRCIEVLTRFLDQL